MDASSHHAGPESLVVQGDGGDWNAAGMLRQVWSVAFRDVEERQEAASAAQWSRSAASQRAGSGGVPRPEQDRSTEKVSSVRAASSTASGATPQEASDDMLLHGVRARDSAALAALYDRHHQLALGVALRLLRNQQLAEDVVQDAYVAIWRQASSYNGGRGTVRNWLLSIVHHRAIDVVRRRTTAAPEVLDETLPDTREPDVWEQAVANIEQEHVRNALDVLPDEQRRTIELAYYGGLTGQEIATRLDVPLGTVKGRMRLALQKLRAQLAPVVAEVPDLGADLAPVAAPDAPADAQTAARERRARS